MSTTDTSTDYYERYSQAIEAGEIEADPTTIRKDNAAALDLILAATGVTSEEESLAMFSLDGSRTGWQSL